MLNFEIKDATKLIGIARSLDGYKAPFKIIENYRLIDNGIDPEATVQIEANGTIIHEAANGSGPVDALATVLKKALLPLFPFLEKINLIDYHAEIINAQQGTATSILVNIIFSDGTEVWKTYASSENINFASFGALIDGLQYAIMLHTGKNK